jgi:formate dehydrogenase beta subunit
MADGHEFKAYLPGGASGGSSGPDGRYGTRFSAASLQTTALLWFASGRRSVAGRLVTPSKEEGVPSETAVRDLEMVMRDSSIWPGGAPNPLNHL